jgi:hypothetical protein
MPKYWFQRVSTGCLLLGAMVVLCPLALPAAGLPPLAAQEHSGQRDPAPSTDQAPSSPEQSTDIDDQVIHDVFGPLQRGMQELNLDKVVSIFDKDQMPGYAQVRDQIRSFFSRYESINFRYQLLQVTSEKDQASAVAEVDMDATPAGEAQMVQRQSLQMRFQMKLGPHGWKVIGFKPSDFFAQ